MYLIPQSEYVEHHGIISVVLLVLYLLTSCRNRARCLRNSIVMVELNSQHWLQAIQYGLAPTDVSSEPGLNMSNMSTVFCWNGLIST